MISDTDIYYAIYCHGMWIAGIGTKPDEAIKDAKHWLDIELNIPIYEIDTGQSKVFNYLYLIKITRKVYEKVFISGGNIPIYRNDNGIYDLDN